MRNLLVIAVVAHFILAGWHGLSHQLVPVPLSTLQTAFVALVILAAPLLGAGLCFSRYRNHGAMLVFASMLASLVFGVVYHFVILSPDNIWCVSPGPWRNSFVVSSVIIAASEAFGTACGAAAMWRWNKAGA